MAVTVKLLMGRGWVRRGVGTQAVGGGGSSSPSGQVLLASSGQGRGDVGPRATDVSSPFGL